MKNLISFLATLLFLTGCQQFDSYSDAREVGRVQITCPDSQVIEVPDQRCGANHKKKNYKAWVSAKPNGKPLGVGPDDKFLEYVQACPTDTVMFKYARTPYGKPEFGLIFDASSPDGKAGKKTSSRGVLKLTVERETQNSNAPECVKYDLEINGEKLDPYFVIQRR